MSLARPFAAGWRAGTAALRRRMGRFIGSRAGNVAPIFALALPVLVGGIAAAMDYTMAARARQSLQSAADSAALAAAREMGMTRIDVQRVQSIVESFVRANTPDRGEGIAIRTSLDMTNRSVDVTLSQEAPGLLSAAIGSAGGVIAASAMATVTTNGASNCIIALDTAAADTLRLTGSSEIVAPDCAIFSNSESARGLAADGSSRIQAEMICTSGGFAGSVQRFTTQPTVDCPAETDPLIARPAPMVGGCTFPANIIIGGNMVMPLLPGVYCGNLEIGGNASVTFLPGIYVFRREFKIAGSARVRGQYVGFYMQGQNARFEFSNGAEIDLSGPRNGPMAGLLFFQDRGLPTIVEHTISANRVLNLTGTIYLPSGHLRVGGSNRVAEGSAYTAIVARRLRIEGAADLVINTRYSETDVPVPAGLGRTTTEMRPRLAR